MLFVVGFIVGIIMGFYNWRWGYLDGDEYNFLVSLIVWIVSAINGVLILGFSEIIQLLEDIKNKK